MSILTAQKKPFSSAIVLLLVVSPAIVFADRYSSHTYAGQGEISTIDAPRQDVGNINTLEYDEQGNRVFISDAVGYEIHISAHGAAGRPLTAIDTNGLTTQLTYDSRGRLIGQAVNDGTACDLHVQPSRFVGSGHITRWQFAQLRL